MFDWNYERDIISSFFNDVISRWEFQSCKSLLEEFEDSKGAIRIRKFKKDRQHHSQLNEKQTKWQNNNSQNTRQKTKKGTTQAALIIGMSSVAPEGTMNGNSEQYKIVRKKISRFDKKLIENRYIWGQNKH